MAFGAAFEREREGGFGLRARDAYALWFLFGFRHNWSGDFAYDASVCCSSSCNRVVDVEPELTELIDESISSHSSSVLTRAMPLLESARASISTWLMGACAA